MKARSRSLLFLLILDLFLWGCAVPTTGSSADGNGSGTTVSYNELVAVSGGSYVQQDTGGNYFTHSVSAFLIGKYEVTYELWYAVRQWAVSNGYVFAYDGKEGMNGTIGAEPTDAKYEPVTMVSWRDCLVWCNAYSKKSGLSSCYTYEGVPVTDATQQTVDDADCDWSADGYRLPSEGEWQYAASDRGSVAWDHAAGDPLPYDESESIGSYAWYGANSGTDTHPVGLKLPNGLGLYDMSGNVFGCLGWYETAFGGSQ